MSSFLDGTGLGHLIEKIKAAFIAKTDTTIATSIDIDSTPTADSTNLVTSGGVKSALDNKANSSDLSVVATTGSYTDLSDKPDIPTEIITGQIVGRMHRDNVSGTGNLTITGASGEGFSPNGITTAGKYIVVVYSWSETKTFGYNISFGSNNYTLSTTDGTISDKRELTVSAGALWSGSVTTAVSAGTTIIVEIYKAEKTTPVLSVGTVALTNLYNDLDGKPTISSSTSSTSTTDIASSKAVKLAYDHGGVQSVNGQTGAVTLSIPDDNTLVHKSGNEPIGGQKTFSSTIVANGGIDVGQGTVSSEDSQDFSYITTGGGDTLQDALDAKQPADFYIVNFTENNGTFTADKTFDQIIDAVEDNKVIIGKWTYIEEGESFTTTYDSVFASDSDAYIKFTSVAGRETDLLIINPDNTVERIYYTLAEDDVYLTKQDTLVSGTNIKTVNNTSLLGSGNISVGTITGIMMNGSSKGTSGVVDLGTVLTAHQDISGKADKSDTYTKVEVNNLIPSIEQDIVVGALPASGMANTIYRVPSTNSYSDYGWDGTQFVLLATYNNAIDDVPTQGSENLVKSGGVKRDMDKLVSGAAVKQITAVESSVTQCKLVASGTQSVIEKIPNGNFRVAFFPVESGKSYKIHVASTRNGRAWGWCDNYISAAPDSSVNLGGLVSTDTTAYGQVYDKLITNTNGYAYLCLPFTYNAGGYTCEEYEFGDVVSYKQQAKSENEKEIARQNIGAASAAIVSDLSSNFDGLDGNVNTIQEWKDIAELSPTKWPKVYGKNDCDFKGRLNSTGEISSTGGTYKYIYQVSDYIHLNARIGDTYAICTAIHETFEGARKNTTSTGHFFGRGLGSTNLFKYFQYRFGDSDYPKGYLMVSIKRKDGASLSDADVTIIESELELEFYALASQGQIMTIQNDVKEIKKETYTLSDFEFFASDSNGNCVDTPARIKFFKETNIGKKFSINISAALQSVSNMVYGVSVFDNLTNAMKSASVGVVGKVVPGWTNSNATDADVLYSGIINVFFKKSDDSAFTYSEVLAILNGVTIEVRTDIAEGVDIDNYEELPIGEFVNLSTTLVAGASALCVPYLGVQYDFVLPSGLEASFTHGIGESLTSSTSWVGNGGSVIIPASSMVHKIQVRNAGGATLNASDIARYVADGAIKVIYKRRDLPVEKRNYDNEKFVKAALYRMGWTSSEEIYELAGLESMPIITHTSDLHGDFKRFENFMAYSKIINANIAISTGDNVLYVSGNGSLFLKDVISKHTGVPFASCIGNHEVYPKNTVSNTDLFNNFIAPYVAQGNYLASANTAATMPYYYVDIAAKNIRLIVINQYDNGCYYGAGLGGRLGQTQVTWLCNTLLSTPAGYGIVIAMHSNEAKINTPETMSAWNQTINWDGGNEDTAGYAANGLYVNAIRPIRTIVDAFISKTSLSTSYDENTVNGNNGETVTINVDFSNVNEGVEFICYLTGHRHKDNVGYVDGATNKQLMLNIVCGNCHYPRGGNLSFSEGCDIPRGDRGVVQDAFNVYAIDRRSGNVRIARVGSYFTFQGVERKFLIAPYKD